MRKMKRYKGLRVGGSKGWAKRLLARKLRRRGKESCRATHEKGK